MPVGPKARAPCSTTSLLLILYDLQNSILVPGDFDHPLDFWWDDVWVAEAGMAALKWTTFTDLAMSQTHRRGFLLKGR